MSPDGSLPDDYLLQLRLFLAGPWPTQRYGTDWRGHVRKGSIAIIEPGLTASEMTRAEAAFQCPLPADLRSLLHAFVPTGDPWRDWRRPELEYNEMLSWIQRKAEFDIRHNEDVWFRAWGERPGETEAAIEAAKLALSRLPPLLPLYGHRFLASEPCESGNPVISMWQFVDSIYYGSDLAAYFHHEFGAPRPVWARDEPRDVPFWSGVVRFGEGTADA